MVDGRGDLVWGTLPQSADTFQNRFQWLVQAVRMTSFFSQIIIYEQFSRNYRCNCYFKVAGLRERVRIIFHIHLFS